jgi:Leucine-rich repeat (LRR) protein
LASFAICVSAVAEEQELTQEQKLTAIEKLGGRIQRRGDQFMMIQFPPESKLKDDDLKLFQGLDSLQIMLSISGSGITDAGLEHLKGVENLGGLYLTNTQVSDAGLKTVGALPKLKAVVVVSDPSLSKASQPFSDEGLKSLVDNNQSLVRIFLSPAKITDDGLAVLKDLPDLQEFATASPAITDQGLKHFAGMGQIKVIGLSQTKITGSGFQYLAGMKLSRLFLSESQSIDDESLKSLQDVAVSWLNVSKTKVTDAGLKHLTEVDGLELLNLDSTQVGDAGMEELKNLPNLRELTLKETQVTDAGLIHLGELSNLQYLELQGSQVTADGVKKLQAKLPKCTIMWKDED